MLPRAQPRTTCLHTQPQSARTIRIRFVRHRRGIERDITIAYICKLFNARLRETNFQLRTNQVSSIREWLNIDGSVLRHGAPARFMQKDTTINNK